MCHVENEVHGYGSFEWYLRHYIYRIESSGVIRDLNELKFEIMYSLYLEW